VLWHAVALGLGGEGFDEASLDLTGVGGEHVLLVEAHELGLREVSQLSDGDGVGHAEHGESGDELHSPVSYT